jgi:hypothetical protein
MSDVSAQYVVMKRALKLFADDNDYCLVCGNHPSSGHSKGCPLWTEPDEGPHDTADVSMDEQCELALGMKEGR